MTDYKKQKWASTSKFSYAPKKGSIEWHKLRIKELMSPYHEKQISYQNRHGLLGRPTLLKRKTKTKLKPPKDIKAQVKWHKLQIKLLKRETS